MLKDSGHRRTFDSGAVRDSAEGKGRCDLLPLDIVARVFGDDIILVNIEFFKLTKEPSVLITALQCFCQKHYYGELAKMILEVSKQYEDGAAKYDENNWRKGIPLHCFIDSGVRHYLKWLRGDPDEPHDRAFVWNILGALWTFHHKPELDDIFLP